MKRLIILIISLALIGCDAELKSTVKVSELNSGHSLSKAVLNIEVSRCNNYEDSRLESSSLIRLKNEVKNIFQNIEYKECYDKRMKSFASFEIPVVIGNDLINYPDVDKVDVAVSKTEGNIFIYTWDSFRKRLESFKKDRATNFNFKITFSLLNDTDKSFNSMHTFNKYLDGIPYNFAKLELNPGSKIDITLNDVDAEILLKSDKNDAIPQGVTPLVFFQP